MKNILKMEWRGSMDVKGSSWDHRCQLRTFIFKSVGVHLDGPLSSFYSQAKDVFWDKNFWTTVTVHGISSAASSTDSFSYGWHCRSWPVWFSARSSILWQFCGTARILQRNTSGICSCSWTRSQPCVPPQPNHTLHTAACSYASPICSDFSPSSSTRGLLFLASPECGSPSSSRGNPPSAPALCARSSWRTQQSHHGWPRCCLRHAIGPPLRPCDISPLGSCPPLETRATAASRSEWCSCQTLHGTCTSSAWFLSLPGWREDLTLKNSLIHAF